jgi:hypothetical protein
LSSVPYFVVKVEDEVDEVDEDMLCKKLYGISSGPGERLEHFERAQLSSFKLMVILRWF